MKKTTIKSLFAIALLACSACITSAFALTVPGLAPETHGGQFTSVMAFNQNVSAWQAFSAQSLESQIEPFLPGGAGRRQVINVEPVFNQDTPDVSASGKALVTALQTAGEKPYPVLVNVDAGTYEIANTGLSVPANVIVTGAGSASTHIQANAITSSSPSITNVNLQVTTLTQNQTMTMQHVLITGSVLVNGGTFTLRNADINAVSGVALTLNGVSGYTLSHVNASSSTTALTINNTVKGFVMGSSLSAPTPINVTENAPAVFVNNVYNNGAPRFYGDYKTSMQRCHNNVDGDTGLPVPNYASGLSSLCVAPQT